VLNNGVTSKIKFVNHVQFFHEVSYLWLHLVP